MPKHYSIATVIDKNRIASLEAFIPMLQIEVVDHRTADHIETIHLCRNGNEDLEYQGNLYISTDFEMQSREELDRPSEVSISFLDRTGVVTRYMQMYRGGVGFRVNLFFLNTGNMTQPPEFSESYSVRTASADTSDYTVSFTLGMANPLGLRVPRRTQRKDRCQWRYKGDECQYSGPLQTCDYSLQGSNGCAAHNNEANFGGFPGINSQ